MNKKTGFIAGTFDILHPGYISALQDAKDNCDYLIVGLHEDPSVERTGKFKPIFSLKERKETLLALKYVNKVIKYKTEKELYDILKYNEISVRFLGDDYINKQITGQDLQIDIVYLSRTHDWSYTKVRNLIRNDCK
jgi:glycerol-3-phosphate cytidylyltransferase